MALPIYQSGNIQLADAPSLQYVDIERDIQTNQRIGKFLEFASEVSGAYATDYAQEQAIKYTIANPITKDRIDAARQSGTDPLDGILSGGMDYNTALKKATAQQTAGVLENELHTHFSDIINKVNRNELTSRDQILNELQAPIQGQIKFFSQIDPELASAYGNQATNLATTKYQTALTLLNKKAEEESLLQADLYQKNASKDFDEWLRNNPGASAAAVAEYISASIAVGMNTSYKFSSNANDLKAAHEEAFNTVRNDYLAEQIAKEFQGKDRLEVVESLRAGKSAYSKHYKDMDPIAKIKFEDTIAAELRLYSSRNAELSRKINEAFADATIAHSAGKKMSATTSKFLADNASAEDGSLKKYQTFKVIDGLVDIVNKSSLADIRTKYETANELVQKGSADDPNFVTNVMTRDFYKNYLNNATAQLSKDPTQYILSMAGEDKQIEFTDITTIDSQFKERLSSLRVNSVKYGIEKAPLLTDAETSQLVTTINGLPATGKIQMINALSKSVPQEYAYDLFKQISPKDVKVGHLGQLLIRNVNPDTIQLMANGMEIININDVYVATPDTHFASKFGTAYDNHPEMKKAITESAKAIYAGLLQKENKPLAGYTKETHAFDADLYLEALDRASGANTTGSRTMGGIVEYNGSSIAIPNNIDQREFDVRMNQATKTNIIDAMVMQVKPNVFIPVVSKVDGKYYKNEYDATSPNKYRVTNQLVDKPLMEYDVGGIIPHEFSLARIKDAQLQMVDEKHAMFRTTDGEYFDAAVNGGEKLTIDLAKLYDIVKALQPLLVEEVSSEVQMIRLMQ